MFENIVKRINNKKTQTKNDNKHINKDYAWDKLLEMCSVDGYKRLTTRCMPTNCVHSWTVSRFRP